MNRLNITLPGYNALTDTNPDHYSMYVNTANVLIKQKVSGQQTVAAPAVDYTRVTIPHNLGYIPFFLVNADYSYVYGTNGAPSQWNQLNNQYNPFQAPFMIAGADTHNLYIINFSSANIPVLYNIFYDNMILSGAASITESGVGVKVAIPGKNAKTSTDPNDYIMHSDLNNFRIVKEGNLTASINGSIGYVTIPHGADILDPVNALVYVKCPDGKTICLGSAPQYVFNESFVITGYIDKTNIYITTYYLSGTVTLQLKYYIFGKAKPITLPHHPLLAVTKLGHNALTETDLDNYNFHSDYNTLKYFYSNSYPMLVNNTAVVTIPHNLGYVPLFIGFINDLFNLNVFNSNSETVYALCPYYLGQSSIGSPNKDIGAFVYADSTNLYLKSYYQPNAVGTVKNFNFYYKLFLNNLGL